MEVSHPKQRGHDGKLHLKYQPTNKRDWGEKNKRIIKGKKGTTIQDGIWLEV